MAVAVAHRGEDVHAVAVPVLDVIPVSPWLEDSYGLYRAVRDARYDRVLFKGHDAYCALRAKQLGIALATTEIAVDFPEEDEDAGFLTKARVGELVTERIVCGLLDARDQPRELPSLVSVVITFHERMNYLEQCLEGLARQTYDAFEVVVADDGSTLPAARGHLGELESRQWPWPFRVLRLPRGGVSAARNAAVDAARGDTVVFLDDDDVPYPELIHVLAHGWAHSGVDVVAAGSRVFRGEGRPHPTTGDKMTIPFGNAAELGLLGNHFGPATALWPRTVFQNLGGFRDVFSEDWELLARASLRGTRIAGTPDPLFWQRVTNAGRYSGSSQHERRAGRAAIAALYAHHVPEQLRLLPLLTAGAYGELDRAARAGQEGRPPLLRRAVGVLRRKTSQFL